MRLLISFLLLFASCVTSNVSADQARDDAIIVRAVERMQGYDYSTDPKVKAAILRHIDRCEGSADYIRLIKKFRPDGIEQKLEKTLLSENKSAAVEAVQLLCELPDGPRQVRGLLKSEDIGQAAQVAEILGLFGNGRAHKILSDMACDGERHYDVRRAAVAGLARNRGGENALLALAESKQLVPDTRLLAGALLARSGDEKIKSRAAKILPQPAQKDQKPLAPLDQLAKMRGNKENGVKLFRGVATCANCHIVDKFGKEVGPNLSEIGSKLSREAMLTSILDPSAGISHNYENYIVLTVAGQVVSGLKMSETDQEVVIRTPEAIDRKFAKDEIEELKKDDKSIMPENLHHTIDQQGLIDIIEYMQTLKKK